MTLPSKLCILESTLQDHSTLFSRVAHAVLSWVLLLDSPLKGRTAVAVAGTPECLLWALLLLLVLRLLLLLTAAPADAGDAVMHLLTHVLLMMLIVIDPIVLVVLPAIYSFLKSKTVVVGHVVRSMPIF